MDHLKGLIGDGMCISQCENLRISVSSRLTQVESSRFCPTDSSRLKSSRFFSTSRLDFEIPQNEQNTLILALFHYEIEVIFRVFTMTVSSISKYVAK